MNKCRGCIWSDKINDTLIFCMFPSCVRKHDVKVTEETTEIKVKKRRKVIVSIKTKTAV